MEDRLVKVATRRTTVGQISMWGTLHISTTGKTQGGWLCDSWTERGTPAAEHLQPQLHWLGKDDDKFHIARLDIPVTGWASLQIGPVDTEIEPRRETFMRTTLAQWENEYFTAEGVRLS